MRGWRCCEEHAQSQADAIIWKDKLNDFRLKKKQDQKPTEIFLALWETQPVLYCKFVDSLNRNNPSISLALTPTVVLEKPCQKCVLDLQ